MRVALALLLSLFFGAGSALAQGQDYSPGFTAGAPEEMGFFAMADGNYAIALEYPTAFEAGEVTWAPWAETSAHIAHTAEGAGLLETNQGFPIAENALGADGIRFWAFQSLYGYDRYNGIFRVMIVDNVLGLADPYEGHLEDGRIAFSNLNTPTYNNLGTDAENQKARFDVEAVSEDSFVITWWVLDFSDIEDGASVLAQPWQPSVRMTYSRVTD